MERVWSDAREAATQPEVSRHGPGGIARCHGCWGGDVLLFADRAEAGRLLGDQLRRLGETLCAGTRPLVLALPRGGVPVAYEVASALHAPLDIFVVRKLGTPAQPELAMGAIASGGVTVMNDEIVRALGITEEEVGASIARETRELRRREQEYRGERAPLDVAGRCVVLVDDGVATGYTVRAAIQALRILGPASIVVAVPVAAQSTCVELKRYADAVVCLTTPSGFEAVGQWYRRFEQTSDEEVRDLLALASDEH